MCFASVSVSNELWLISWYNKSFTSILINAARIAALQFTLISELCKVLRHDRDDDEDKLRGIHKTWDDAAVKYVWAN